MENQKPKHIGNPALRIAGWILSGMGALWLALGAAFLTIWANVPMDEGEAWVMGAVFAGIGAVMLLIGLTLLLADGKKRKHARRLMAEGTCYEAVVVNSYHSNTRVNGRPGLILECRYTDERGEAHLVKSDAQYRFAAFYRNSTEPARVKVWVDPYDAKQYFVDVGDPLLADGSVTHDDR